MKNYFIVIFIFILCPIFSYDLANSIKISQKNINLDNKNSYYKITNTPFDIIINGIGKNDAVYIYTRHNDDFKNDIKIPSPVTGISFFLPGTGMAVKAEGNGMIPLYICSKYSHNHITEDRRIRKGNDIVIKITGIYEVYDSNKVKDKIFMAVFSDKNNNQIIEKGEIAYINFQIQ
jgi:hypothetical protein